MSHTSILAQRPGGATRPGLPVGATVALLCARERIDRDPDGSAVPERVRTLRDRCEQVEDWDVLIDRVDTLRILPLVHRHLSEHAADVVPAPVLAELGLRARRTVLRNLQVADVHLRLTRDVLTPMGVPHLFVKGTTLAHRFYREPNLRVARDVDVLVPRAALESVAVRLRELGYRASSAPLGSDDGIRYASRVVGHMDWVTPDGVLIEVHSMLPLSGGRLATERLLRDPANVTLGGISVPTLHDADALMHACLHHTRSSMARLHWVTDLDAMVRVSGPAEAMIATARERRFEHVVTTALELHRTLARPDPGAGMEGSRHHGHDVLLALCLTSLARKWATNDDRPLRPRERARARNLAFSDMPRLARVHLRLRSISGRFLRQTADYVRLPLPTRWHGAYLLLRPILVLFRRYFDASRAAR